MGPSCALDESGLRAPLQRFRPAARNARLIERTPRRLVADLDQSFDERTITRFTTSRWNRRLFHGNRGRRSERGLDKERRIMPRQIVVDDLYPQMKIPVPDKQLGEAQGFE